MAGVSRLSAYEIAGNPDDIVCGAFKDKDTGKYGGTISRGPGHNYKLIISTNPGYDTQEEAVAGMRDLVEGINEAVEKELAKPQKR